RVVALQLRQADGSFVEPPPQPMKPVKFFSGGGGLYSTAGGYLKFERMVLNGGVVGGERGFGGGEGGEERRNQRGGENLRGVEEHDSAVEQESRSLAGFARQVWMGIRNQQPGGGRRARGGVAGMGRHLQHVFLD